MIELGLVPQDEASASELAADRLKRAVMSVLGCRFTEQNRIEALRNGREIFPAMVDAMKGAKRSIDFVTFVYWKGDIARKVARTLAKKAREGVQVRVILDGFGSLPMDPALISTLENSGVQVERFRPIVRWKLWESDHRTHRKILVVDNEVAFTGGVGIAEEWEGDARNPKEWRDTHFRIEGPAVLGLRAAFLTDWRDTGHPIGPGDIAEVVPAPAGDMTAAVIDGSSQIGYNDAERLLEALVAAAEERILIQTPYFNPDDAILDALVEASRRGVEVDVVLPGPHIDKRVSLVVGRDRYASLIDSGVRVWEYQRSMMHVKAFMVDGVLSVIGSVNLNRRSVEKDEEVAVAVVDPTLTAVLESHFWEDVEASNPMSPDGVRPTLRERVLLWLLRPLRREF